MKSDDPSEVNGVCSSMQLVTSPCTEVIWPAICPSDGIDIEFIDFDGCLMVSLATPQHTHRGTVCGRQWQFEIPNGAGHLT